MSKKRRNVSIAEPSRWYRGADIPMSVIRGYARKLAERFQPDKIILFGSHAYGQPHEDSDVDLLVVMPARNELDQAFKIRWQLPAPFCDGPDRPHPEGDEMAPRRRRIIPHGDHLKGQSPL